MKTLKLTIALILCCSVAVFAQSLPLGSNNWSGNVPESGVSSPYPPTHSISIDFYLTSGYSTPFAVGTATFDGNPMTYLRFDTSLGLCYDIYVGTARYIVYLQVLHDSLSNEFYYGNLSSPGIPVLIEKQGW